LANQENKVLDLRLARRALEEKRRRLIELYKDGQIDKVEYLCDLQVVDNRLKTIAPIDVTMTELAIADFERFGETWDQATPDEQAELLKCMVKTLYVNFRTGQLVEIVPKPGLRYVLEGAELTRPLAYSASGTELTIGDPDGDRGVPAQTKSDTCCVARSA